MTLNDIKQKLEYKLRVSKADHEKSLEQSAFFFEELMGYFKSDLEYKLKPLNPNPLQKDIMRYALELHTKGALKNTENEGRVLGNKQPCLLKEYETNAGFEENKRIDSVLMQMRAAFKLRWSVAKEMPHILYAGLFVGHFSASYLYFWFLREKVTNPDQLKDFYFHSKRKKEDIAVYESGTRLVHNINYNNLLGAGEKSVAFHFHLMGGFESKTTESMQFLYGCNQLTDERSGFFRPFELREKF